MTTKTDDFWLFFFFLDSMLQFFFFFFKDFSSKFVCHKNLEGVPDFAEGFPFLFYFIYFFMGKQIIKFKFLYI